MLKDYINKVIFTEIDPEYSTMMAIRMTENKSKYGLFNWKNEIDPLLIIDALERHIVDIKSFLISGKPLLTEEPITDHLASVGCNAMILNYQLKNNERINRESKEFS
jgi:hypothetical protein